MGMDIGIERRKETAPGDNIIILGVGLQSIMGTIYHTFSNFKN